MADVSVFWTSGPSRVKISVMMRWGLILMAGLCLGCGEDKTPEPAPAPEKSPAAKKNKKPASSKKYQGFIKAQLNDRLVNFNRPRAEDNYLVGTSFRLNARTRDGEQFELIGTNAFLPDAKFPLVLKSEGEVELLLRYSTGLGTEWTDASPTIRVEKFEDGRMVGSFHSELLRPTKPAVPIRISGGLFDLVLADRK